MKHWRWIPAVSVPSAFAVIGYFVNIIGPISLLLVVLGLCALSDRITLRWLRPERDAVRLSRGRIAALYTELKPRLTCRECTGQEKLDSD